MPSCPAASPWINLLIFNLRFIHSWQWTLYAMKVFWIQLLLPLKLMTAKIILFKMLLLLIAYSWLEFDTQSITSKAQVSNPVPVAIEIKIGYSNVYNTYLWWHATILLYLHSIFLLYLHFLICLYYIFSLYLHVTSGPEVS